MSKPAPAPASGPATASAPVPAPCSLLLAHVLLRPNVNINHPHLSEKRFSVFNGPPPITIEHTKTSSTKCFTILFIKVCEKSIFL